MSSDNMTQETATSQTPSTESAASVSSAQTSTPSSQPTAQATQSAPSVASAVQQASQVAQATQAPVYTPDFKFKAYEKEYEVDELFRPLFKDKDTEAKIKALHSKAYAMESMKEKLEGTRKETDTYKAEIAPKIQAYESFNKILANKDWDTFFNKLKVPDEEIFAYVEKKLALMNASPDQKAEYERMQSLRQQAYVQEEQIRQYETAYQQQAVQARTMQLDTLMARPDVQKYATAWDEKMGSIGSFRQLVIDEAAAAFYATGQDWPAEQAINHVIQKFGKVVTAQQMAQAAAAGQPQATQPPVIPHVAGRGTSPVKKVPKSLDDLRKMGDEMSR